MVGGVVEFVTLIVGCYFSWLLIDYVYDWLVELVRRQ